jgi:hypothetical protein
MKRVTGRAWANIRGKAEIQVIEKKQVIVARGLQTLFSRNRFQSDYVYENTSCYERSVKKQGEVKSLKIIGLSSCGSAPGRKKMLKMKDDPTMCMKTQDRATECLSRNHIFLIKSERF